MAIIKPGQLSSGPYNISGSFTGSFTGSLSGVALTASYATQALSSSFATTAQTANTASYVLNAVSSSFSSTASFVQTSQTASYVLNAVSASYANVANSVNTLNQSVLISGSLTVLGGGTFYGSSSFVYLTASQLDISASFISVNVFEPVERFGGLIVYDSGSSLATASLAWDSLHNHWVYQNVSGASYTGGMLLSGPRNTGSLGDEPNLTKWFIPRSDGGDHLDNSQIFSSGSTHIATGSLTVTQGVTASLLGTASYATQALSASFAPATPPFPFTGSALITGSLGVTGSYSSRLVSPASSLWQTHFSGERFDGAFLQGRVYIKTNYPFVEDFYIGKNSGSANNDTSTNGGIHYSHNGVFTVRNTQTSGFFGVTLNANQNLTQRVGIDSGNTSFSEGWSLRNFTNSTDYINFAHNSGRVGIGWNDKTTSLLGATLDVKASSSAASDIAFRVRNSADTRTPFAVLGNEIIQISDDGVGFGASSLPLNIKSATNSFTSWLGLDIEHTVRTGYFSLQSQGLQDNYNQVRFSSGGSKANAKISAYITQTNTDKQGHWHFRTQVHLGDALRTYNNNLGQHTLLIETGSIPTTSSANSFITYASASSAGNASPHFRTENGSIIKLYQQSAVTSSQGIADALTNLGFLTGSSVISSGTSFGPFGIANSSGSYTYYNTFSASMAAATSGQTVEMFADVTETTNISIALKNGVNINGNGHTYTLNQAGTANCIQDGGAAVNCSISNITFRRLGGTASSVNTICMYITGASRIKAYSTILIGGATNMRCLTVNNASAEVYGIYAEGYNPVATITNGIVYNSEFRSINGAGLIVETNGTAIKCIAYGFGADGLASSGKIIDCVGYGALNNGISVSAGLIQNCTGYGGGGVGISMNGSTIVALNCTGYSVVGAGIFTSSPTSFDLKGYSTAAAGISIINGIAYDSLGYSTANNGISATNSGATITELRSCKAISTAATAINMANTTSGCKIYNTEAYSKWNNAAGHGIVVAGQNAEIVQCVVEVTNASANCISGSSALTTKYANCSFKGATITVNANITQGMINTHDNFGNIII